MSRSYSFRRFASLVFLWSLISSIAMNAASAQISGGGGTGAGNGNAGGINNGGNAPSGIRVDTEGLVKIITPTDQRDLADKRRASRRSQGEDDVTAKSDLRKVSLVRLEKACQAYANDQTHVTEEMQNLAGLQRIDYLFVYPESGELVIAGPAEGFAEDATGRSRGISTGRPTLQLDDLMVALRAVARGEDVGCSIDARPENLARFKEYQAANSGASSEAVARRRFAQMAKILGKQKVSIWGVPEESHFARTLVEADYFMKKISIGQMKVRVRGFKTHLDMVRPGDDMANRWWFTPSYDPFTASADGNAYAITGQRCQLWAENEVITPEGKRVSVGIQAASTDRYAKHFTEKFPALAEAVPAFAELQTLFDLLTVAALMKQEGLAERVDWPMSLFLDEQRATVAKGNVPRDVETTVAFKRTRRRILIGMVGGGVVISPTEILRDTPIKPAEGDIAETLKSETTEPLPEGRWWWD